ncbi:hypothetical protein [Pedobacter ginsengisoli]|uniref:hypothetical protein n=1 Tax=Pedobacter ginsengisoli TaxID=363852 RepID=UPI0012FDDFEA|nr:hypothetical protein [Pedobacter ginsengisoli]
MRNCYFDTVILSRYRLILLTIAFYGFSFASAQVVAVNFTSSDKDLERAFNWAKETALNYRGADTDPAGPWYEAALPSRYAFCMRDASHQCIGAEILGMGRENLNMFTLFAQNISAAKNWCSYWEINKHGRPAPEDYRNDKEFWYNLPANFDVLFATWRLYKWTGNKYYLNHPSFVLFQKKTVKEYIDTWVLSADSLLTRPAHLHTPIPYNENDYFHSCRGLPSYSEGIPNMKTGIDLIAAIYRGLQTYSDILSYKGQHKEAKLYAMKADHYRERLEADWWNKNQGHYYLYYSSEGKFVKDGPVPYLLWFDALKDTSRIKRHMKQIASAVSNVETTSYFPYLFYKNGEWDQARRYLLYLSDPTTPRREYPEVSFGVIDGIVQGLMGISPDAQTNTISTLFRSNSKGSASLNSLPVLQTIIKVTHNNERQTIICNSGKKSIKWKALFMGNYPHAIINGIAQASKKETNAQGKVMSWVLAEVKPGKQITVNVKP